MEDSPSPAATPRAAPARWLSRNAEPVEPELATRTVRPTPLKIEPSRVLEEASLALLDPQQVVARGGVENESGIDSREVDGVAHQPVPLGVRAGRDRRGVHPRHGREHGVVLLEPHAVVGQLVQAWHEPRDHVVGSKPVEDHEQLERLRFDTASLDRRERDRQSGTAVERPTSRTTAALRLRRGLMCRSQGGDSHSARLGASRRAPVPPPISARPSARDPAPRRANDHAWCRCRERRLGERVRRGSRSRRPRGPRT